MSFQQSVDLLRGSWFGEIAQPGLKGSSISGVKQVVLNTSPVTCDVDARRGLVDIGR